MPEYVVDFGQSGPPPEADGRLDANAFHRNHVAIWSVLSRFVGGRSGHVLEIGSGTGQHATEFSRRAPAITWWPTDFSDSHLRSIAAWRAFSECPNMQAPVRLDASAPDWALNDLGLPSEFIAIFCANVIHISPWSVSQGLMAGAARHLAGDGRLLVYGPFRRDGVHSAPSNAAFDESLRAENPAWGCATPPTCARSRSRRSSGLPRSSKCLPTMQFSCLIVQPERGDYPSTEIGRFCCPTFERRI